MVRLGNSDEFAIDTDALAREVGRVTVGDAEAVTSITPISDGLNISYRAQIAGEQDISTVVKLGTFHRPERFTVEPEVIDLVAENSDLPVPNILGKSLPENSPVSYPFYVMEELDGKSGFDVMMTETERGEMKALANLAGQHLGRLHRDVTVPYVGTPVRSDNVSVGTVEKSNRWPEVFAERATQRIEQIDYLFYDLKRDLHTQFSPELFPNVRQYSLCNLDYWWENLLISDEDGITGVVDWGLTIAGDPMYAVAMAEYILIDNLDWEETPATESELRESFRDGYKAEHRLAAPRDDVWRLYQLDTRIRALKWFRRFRAYMDEEKAKNAEERYRNEVEILLSEPATTPPQF